MIKLEDKGRDYQRYRHSAMEKIYLANNDLQHVLSSNVSAIGVAEGDLIIRFHNGSMYQYKGIGDKFKDIMASNSKGKWVWRNLRKKYVQYKKIGVLPLPDDIEVTDDEIFKEIDDRYVKDLMRNLGDTLLAQALVYNPLLARSFTMVTIGDIIFYKPI